MFDALAFPGIAAAALAVSVLAPVVLRPWLEDLGVVDVASARSSHVGTVVRGLGLACVVSVTLVCSVAYLLTPELGDDPMSWIVLLVALACGLLGWMEDLRGVSILGRLGAQILIGTVAMTLIAATTGASWWFILVGAVAVPALVNATNFMDGVNGISGLYALVAGGYFAVIGALESLPWLSVAGLIVAAAYVGFLPWNFGWLRWPASFMGDAGSYLLGGILSAMALGAFFDGVPIETVMGPFLIYLADTGFTLARRMVEGKAWFSPHREHVYQRLTDVGFSHVASALTVTGFTALTCIVGAAGSSDDATRLNTAAFITVLAVLTYLALPAIATRVKSMRTPHPTAGGRA